MTGRKMLTCYVILVLVVIFHQISDLNAQVTFSKDWNAGKRSAPNDCAMSIKSAASICQMLLTELKAAASCEVRSLIYSRLPDPPDSAEIFAQTHNG